MTTEVPRIILAGWGPGPRSLSIRCLAGLLESASCVYYEPEAASAARRASTPRPAPASAEECARHLIESARTGTAVWLTGDDPLGDPKGAAIARLLTHLGEPWQYVPAIEAAALGRPGAVAHLGSSAALMSDEERAAWQERFPLLGLRAVVTRAAHQAGALVGKLALRGAETLECPAIAIGGPADPDQLDTAIERAGTFDWIVFTSANGANRFFERLLASGRDVRVLKNARIAAIGPATAQAVERFSLRVDLIPEKYVAESLVSALVSEGTLAGSSILIARAAVARDVIPDALRAADARVTVAEVYRTSMPQESAATLRAALASNRVDLVTFTSSSTVVNFVEMVGLDLASRPAAACIGPITAQTAREAGLAVAVEAEPFTVDGLVRAIETWWAPRR